MIRIIGLKIGVISPNHLRVLIFHDIPPEQEDAFKKQLVWLKKHWSIISPEKFEKLISGNEPIIGANLLISFDDGLISNRIVAEKILKPMGIKAIFFVVSDFVDLEDNSHARQFIADHIAPDIAIEDVPDNWANMHWSDLQYLLNTGHTIGAHTRKHTRLSNCYTDEELYDELIVSAECIKKNLGVDVQHFAFTFGDIDSFSEKALTVARSQYQYIYSGIRGDNAQSLSPLSICRDSAATQSDNYEYILFENNLLAAFLNGVADIKYKKSRKLLDSWI
jgi:peptidoglycan/xylan/chitin deacetylase (PgdA/CDA1 family)